MDCMDQLVSHHRLKNPPRHRPKGGVQAYGARPLAVTSPACPGLKAAERLQRQRLLIQDVLTVARCGSLPELT